MCFADLRSPQQQRGLNESCNGLVPERFPKEDILAADIARMLNKCQRKLPARLSA